MEKILLIGENTPFLESIAGEFNNLGFTAFTAGEEDKALEIITQEAPDVLVLPMGIKRFNSLKLVFKLREVNLLSKLVYLHPEDVIPNPPDRKFFLFVPDSLSPDLIVTKIIESIDSTLPMGEMSIREVLWLLKVENRSALIRIFTDEAEGEIFVVDGNPVACKLGFDVGDEAFESLIKYESIAYEILWDVPEGIERNIVKDYEEFFGPHIKKPVSEEGEPEESIEDLSRELEVEIQELGIEKSDEEISLDEFPTFEEENWDLGEDTLKELEKAGGAVEKEEDISELFKEEKKKTEEFSLDLGAGEPFEKEPEEKPEEKGLELPEEFAVSEEELSEFPPLEEEKKEEMELPPIGTDESVEFPPIGEKTEEKPRESEETEFPSIKSDELAEFPPVEEEKTPEFLMPEEKKEEIPPVEQQEAGFEAAFTEEEKLPPIGEESVFETQKSGKEEEFPTLEGTEFEIPGEESTEEPEELKISESLEGSEFEVPGEEISLPEELTEEKVETPAFEETSVSFEVSPDYQNRLENVARGIRGLLKIGLVKGQAIVAGIPDHSLDKEIEKLVFDEFDEVYKKSGTKVIASVKKGELVIWTVWSKVPAGYALFETKRIFEKVQE